MAIMFISTKGVNFSIKNIMADLNYMVDSTIEDKFDARDNISLLVTYMDVNSCDHVFYFEQTKRNLRLWIANNEITLRFSILNYASIYDLSTVYNYHKHSGHVLLFSAAFDEDENLKIFKEIAKSSFKCEDNTSIEKSICFFYLNGRICMRCYLLEDGVEIGPRLDLQLDRIFEGCFKGKRTYGKEEADLIAKAKAELFERENRELTSEE